ncbi:Arginine-binding extracellular protein ArtP precursor [Clostridiales bacterium CHKCI006]|nr:Arginine-binding extracellular protein ArtP precursor [Clostridiales bacterium CHKCI006]
MKAKKLLTLGLAALMTFSFTACSTEQQDAVERIKAQGYITLGTSPDYAPSEFYIDDNGTKRIVGSDIALAQAVADKLGVELQIQESDFNTVIANAQAGTIDMGISGFAWEEDRAEVVDFSDDYSRDSGTSFQGLMIRKEDVDKYQTKEDIRANGAIVGAQAASIQYTMSLTIADEDHIVQLADTTNCAAQLSTGDIDAFVCTSTQAVAMMETYDNIMLLPKETFNMDPDNFYNRTGVIFSKDPAYDSLEEVVNEVIAEAKVPNEEGKTQLDIWYEEAVALMPFDLTEELKASGELPS